MKPMLVAISLSVLALGLPATAQEARNPTIWNAKENQVAVLKGSSLRLGLDFVVVHPTKMWSGLGRYQVVMSRDALRPRAKGGWYTDVTIDEFPHLRPEVPQYFQPSGT
jgi:hypothetical protein